MTTKISVSLSDDDLAVLDEQVRTARLPGRSAAVAVAVKALRERGLAREYAEEFSEDNPELAVWDKATGDGLR